MPYSFLIYFKPRRGSRWADEPFWFLY